MKGKLYQLLGDGIEELYYTEDESFTDDRLRLYYNEWLNTESDNFEEYMDLMHPDIGLTRIFVEEVFV